MSKETGGPAFPKAASPIPAQDNSQEGMTLWDKFYDSQARALVHSAALHCSLNQLENSSFMGNVARVAASYADALISERKKRFEDSNV